MNRTPLSEYPTDDLITELKRRRDALYNAVKEYDAYCPQSMIKQVVAHEFRVPVDSLHASGRSTKTTFPRQVAMAIMRDSGLPLQEVARHFGKHHATVLYACRVVRDAESMQDQDARRIARCRKSVSASLE